MLQVLKTFEKNAHKEGCIAVPPSGKHVDALYKSNLRRWQACVVCPAIPCLASQRPPCKPCPHTPRKAYGGHCSSPGFFRHGAVLATSNGPASG